MVKKGVEKGKSDKELKSDTLPNGYDPEQVRRAVKALLGVVEKDDSKKKSLFSDEGDFVLIQVSCVRIPKLTRKNYRFLLPHGILKDTSEVCLFVRNLHGSKDLEYEETVRHYKNLLSETGVTSIHEVISVNQLKQEYKTYEMKRRLAARFDMFLGDSVVNDWLNGLVGKNFHRCKKVPNPVKLDSPDLKAAIDRALHKTTMVVTGNGDNYSAKVGNTQQSIDQICENIDTFVKGLKENFPGKWGNVKALHIRVTNGICIPIYLNIVIPNAVRIPKVKLRPDNKSRRIDEGELSTLPDGYKVIVKPDGSIKIKKPPRTETNEESKELSDEDEEFFDEDEVSDMDDDSGDDGEMSDSKIEEIKEEAAESESEEDSEVEAAEEAYLQELTMENQIKKKRKGEEEPAPPRKVQKKIKVEESLVLKNDGKKIKDLSKGTSVKISKGNDIVEEKSLSTEKSSKKRKNFPSSMQWQVENIDVKPTKKVNGKTKIVVNEKTLDKSSVSESATLEPKVKIKAEPKGKFAEKVVKKKCVTDLPSSALNSKVKKSKTGKIKKG